jgi:hypothetical protein
MYAIAYNLVRVAMCEATGRQGVMADRISFVDALRWLRGAEEGRRCRNWWSTRGARAGTSPGAEAAAQAIPADEEAEGRIAQALEGERLGCINIPY